MPQIKHSRTFCVLFALLFNTALCFAAPPLRKGGTRLFFGPAVGFYTINKNHAINPVQRTSVLAGLRREQRIGQEFKTYLLFGVDYFFHGVGFNSYYFKPESLKIYDKSFAYRYNLSFHELNLPLQFKYLFKREDNSLFSPYAVAGYHLRYLVFTQLSISGEGNEVHSDQPDLQFKNPLLWNKLNSAVSIGLGWQKNRISRSRGSFFVEVNFRYCFSPYYFEADYAPSSLFINSTHIHLLLGLKF